jgi:hypothetical protein
MRRAAFAIVAIVCISKTAHAEDGDPGSTHRLQYTTEPLRLALTREPFQFMGRMPGCERSEEPPVDRWLTKDLSPHLHFLGIIRSGCGMETGGGGGLAYSIEVKPNFFVVASIGAWLTPRIEGVRDHRLDPVARLDFIWAMKDGRSFNLGLFASKTTFGLGFGFVF